MNTLRTFALSLSCLLSICTQAALAQDAPLESRAIALPQQGGAVSAAAQASAGQSTGSLNLALPIEIPPGRNGVQPNLGLSYSSTNGNGPLGLGWQLSQPATIQRDRSRGVPNYFPCRNGLWCSAEDRFTFGGAELVPVLPATDGMSADYTGAVPADLSTWQQYRLREEGAFARFFRSPDSTRWVIQYTDGSRYDYGIVPTAEVAAGVDARYAVLSSNAGNPAAGSIYAWFPTRYSDVHGSTIYYAYGTDLDMNGTSESLGNNRYLTEVYYRSPDTCAPAGSTAATRRSCVQPTSDFGARVRLVYQTRSDAFTSYASGWPISTGFRLRDIIVTVKEDGAASREFVRRYRILYGSTFHSLVYSVQLEGRLDAATHGTFEVGAQTTEANIDLAYRNGSPAFAGRRGASQIFYYSSLGAGGPVGFGALRAWDEAACGANQNTPWCGTEVNANLPALSRSDTEIMDVNGDGLADVMKTPAPVNNQPVAPLVFFNGFDLGSVTRPGALRRSVDLVMSVPAAERNNVRFAQQTSAIADEDGDGRAEFVQVGNGSAARYVFARSVAADGSDPATPSGQSWAIAKAVRTALSLPAGVAPNFTTTHRMLDINGDRLSDIVRVEQGTIGVSYSLANVVPTYRLDANSEPIAYGSLGNPNWTNTEVVQRCFLRANNQNFTLANGVRFTDVNGDDIVDAALVHAGGLYYWPGSGNGRFGVSVGGHSSCGVETVNGVETLYNNAISMAAPAGTALVVANSQLVDVDADGLVDLVEATRAQIRVLFNKGGSIWSTLHTVVTDDDANFAIANVRFADMNGNGTLDYVHGRGGQYTWHDLAVQRLRLMTSYQNGIGGSSQFTWDTTSQDYLADAAAAAQCGANCTERVFTWQNGAADQDIPGFFRSTATPVPLSVLRSMTDRDNLHQIVGGNAVTVQKDYQYHGGYYEGAEQQVRNFNAVDETLVNQDGGASTTIRTFFHQGKRTTNNVAEIFRDNPESGLAGKIFMIEKRDSNGNHLSTQHTAWALRTLRVGSTVANGIETFRTDGRNIVFAYPLRTRTWLYDTAPFEPNDEAVQVDEVYAEGSAAANRNAIRTGWVRVRGLRYAETRREASIVLDSGFVTEETDFGRVRGENNLPSEIDTAIVSVKTAARNAAAAETSKWLWRVTATSIRSGGLTYRSSTYAYDNENNLTSSTRVATASSYNNFGDADLVHARQDIVDSTRFDAWGSKTAVCNGANIASGENACLRLRTITYDASYRQYAVSENLYMSGAAALVSTATWNAGFGKMTSMTDARGEQTSFGYDGLGRMTLAYEPTLAGCADGIPTARYNYFLGSSARPISVVTTTNEADCNLEGGSTLVSHQYIDGLGRNRGLLSRGDRAGDWIQSGITGFDSRGLVVRAYSNGALANPQVLAGDIFPNPALALTPANAGGGLPPSSTSTYDGFGRVASVTNEMGATSETRYHALSAEHWDALDLSQAPVYAGTFSLERQDGFGRTIQRIEQERDASSPNSTRYIRVSTTYRADGVPLTVRRSQIASTAIDALETAGFTRTFYYDTLGRKTGSSDPDTRTAGGAYWKYLYNTVGDLVATRDPRGCGQNHFYDRAGRRLGTKNVTCSEAQASLEPSAVQLAAGNVGRGVVALGYTTSQKSVDEMNYYDITPFGAAQGFGAVPNDVRATGNYRGLLTGYANRAVRGMIAYDDRAHAVYEARQVSLPGRASTVLASFDEIDPAMGNDPGNAQSINHREIPAAGDTQVARLWDTSHTYQRSMVYDNVNRMVSFELPSDPDPQGGAAHSVGGSIAYTGRGLPSQTSVIFDGAARPIHNQIAYDVRGNIVSVTYGDAIGLHDATVATMTYDALSRPLTSLFLRDNDGVAQGLRRVTKIASWNYSWDAANNLTQIVDSRTPSEWPAGARPRNVSIEHDSLYRVTNIDYSFNYAANDVRLNDAFVDWRTARSRQFAADPMRASAAPRLPTDAPDLRAGSIHYEYDFLANTTAVEDDQSIFYERGLGGVQNGTDATAGRPGAMHFATTIPSAAPADPGSAEPRGGWVEIDYGISGNMEAKTVYSECRDAAAGNVCRDTFNRNADARGDNLRSHCICARAQHYEYRYDEENQLTEARRYDASDIRPNVLSHYTLAARETYRYDTYGDRIIEESGTGAATRVALTVFPGDFERRGLAKNTAGSTFDAIAPILDLKTRAVRDAGTETQYLVAGARIVWKAGAPVEGTSFDPNHRIALPLQDFLNSTAAVLDIKSGQLLEASTYLPTGARDTLLVSDVAAAPEAAGFTGKEEDESVGLTYFGKRWLDPRLGRWITPDPLAIETAGGGEALNSYHYVSGRTAVARDPIGLDGEQDAAKQNPMPAGYKRAKIDHVAGLLNLDQEQTDALYDHLRVTGETVDEMQSLQPYQLRQTHEAQIGDKTYEFVQEAGGEISLYFVSGSASVKVTEQLDSPSKVTFRSTITGRYSDRYVDQNGIGPRIEASTYRIEVDVRSQLGGDVSVASNERANSSAFGAKAEHSVGPGQIGGSASESRESTIRSSAVSFDPTSAVYTGSRTVDIRYIAQNQRTRNASGGLVHYEQTVRHDSETTPLAFGTE